MAFSTLFKIIPEPLGLDLSDRSIKAVKLSKRGDSFRLVDFGETSIPEGLLKQGVIQSEKKLSNILKKAIGDINGALISCSLPEQQTYLRVVQLPAMGPEELKEAIRWEVEANIPLSLEEVYFDWEIIKQKKSRSHLDILVTAAPRELVDSYTSLFESSGFRLYSLEPESIALARSAVSKKETEGAIMVIDIGLTHTLFVIYAANSVRFASSVASISGFYLNQAIGKSLKIDVKRAEKVKKEMSLKNKDDKASTDAVTPILSALLEQTKEYIKFYEAHAAHSHEGRQISKILLTGGDSLLDGIEEHISSFVKIPVERANPFENILNKSSGAVKITQKDALRYSTALGLAMGGLSRD